MSLRECPVCGCTRAENELLCTDAKRYQWLKKHMGMTSGLFYMPCDEGPTELDAAVDYAMSKEATE